MDADDDADESKLHKEASELFAIMQGGSDDNFPDPESYGNFAQKQNIGSEELKDGGDALEDADLDEATSLVYEHKDEAVAKQHAEVHAELRQAATTQRDLVLRARAEKRALAAKVQTLTRSVLDGEVERERTLANIGRVLDSLNREVAETIGALIEPRLTALRREKAAAAEKLKAAHETEEREMRDFTGMREQLAVLRGLLLGYSGVGAGVGAASQTAPPPPNPSAPSTSSIPGQSPQTPQAQDKAARATLGSSGSYFAKFPSAKAAGAAKAAAAGPVDAIMQAMKAHLLELAKIHASKAGPATGVRAGTDVAEAAGGGLGALEKEATKKGINAMMELHAHSICDVVAALNTPAPSAARAPPPPQSSSSKAPLPPAPAFRAAQGQGASRAEGAEMKKVWRDLRRVSHAECERNKALAAPWSVCSRAWHAADDGDMATLRPLVDEWFNNDAVLNFSNPSHGGFTPLMAASRKGNLSVVTLLLSAPGTSVNKGDNYGCTALIASARYGHAKIVRLLLATDGIHDVNKSASDGCNALMWAAYHGRAEVIRTLLAVPNININATAKKSYWSNRTALDIAVFRRQMDCAALLRAAGGNGQAELMRLVGEEKAISDEILGATDKDSNTLAQQIQALKAGVESDVEAFAIARRAQAEPQIKDLQGRLEGLQGKLKAVQARISEMGLGGKLST